MPSFDVSFVYRIVDRYTDKIKKITRSTSGLQNVAKKTGFVLGKSLGGSLRGLGSLGQKMKNIGSAANSAGAAISTFAFAFPINKARAFESAITDMDKVMEFANAGQRKDFIEDLKRMGPGLGLNAANMAILATEAAKMGVAAGNATKFVELAAKAKSAFDLEDVGQAGNIVADLKQKFSLDISGVENLIDSINHLSDRTGTTAEGLLEVAARTSNLFASVKIPPEVGAGLSAFAREVSVTPELAASGLKLFTQKMIEMGQGANLAKDPVAAIQGIIDKFKNAPQEVLQKAFGREAAPFVSSLITKNTRFAEVMGLVADKTAFAGSATVEHARKMGTNDAKLAKLRAQFDNIMIALGEQLLPILAKIADRLGPILEKVRLWVKENPGLTKIGFAVAAISAALLPIIGVVGGIIVGLTSMGVIAGSVVAGIVAIGVAVIAFSDDLKSIGTWIKDVFVGLWDMIADKVSGITSIISSVGDFFGISSNEPTISEREISSNVAVDGATQQNVNLNGRIGVDVAGPGRVRDTELTSSPPGNLGFNTAMAGG